MAPLHQESPAILESRFKRLADRWRVKAEFLSSDSEIAMLPEYQSIIGMGPAAVPLILHELEAQPDHWFWALAAITGENPTPPDKRGQIDVMREAWLAWGRSHGLI
jgi:hypothetical protein